MRILILLLMVFIISCGDDNQEEKKLPCDPSSSTLTTDEISGVWYGEKLIITNNDCTDRDLGKDINLYLHFEKLNECIVSITECMDGANCTTLKEGAQSYILESNELKNSKAFNDGEFAFDNCHIKKSEIETITFDVGLKKAFYKFKQNILLYPPCYDYKEGLTCNIEGKVDIDREGARK